MKNTIVEARQVSFINIFAVEFFNTALILLIISFTPIGQIYGTENESLDHNDRDVQLNGYSTFNSDWYLNVG